VSQARLQVPVTSLNVYARLTDQLDLTRGRRLRYANHMSR